METPLRGAGPGSIRPSIQAAPSEQAADYSLDDDADDPGAEVVGLADPQQPADELLSARDGAGERVDRFVARMLPDVSRSRVQQWIALGAVRCDERPLAAKTRLAGWETLRVRRLPREADQAFAPDAIDLPVVHEDGQLLVIDKPAGLVVHPAAGHWRGTLLNGLLHRDRAFGELPRAGIVHRLDKDTSGLMVVARSETACASLVAQLADRSMSRRYLAIVAGRPAAEGTVDAPIGRDPAQRTRMAVVDRGGKPAHTAYRSLATGTLEGRAVALVECRLRTGRTHQIRVHMRHLGHPLLGDRLYGGPALGIARQALHSWHLSLRHPTLGEQQQWERVPPADFVLACTEAGIDARACIARVQGAPR